MTKLDESTIAYIAGIVDGEGYIGGHKTNNNIKGSVDIRCAIGMKYEAGLFDILKLTYGGNISLNKNGCLYYDIKGKACENFLRDIRPYIKVKAQQLEMALRIRSTKTYRGRKGIPQDVEIERLEICQKIKDLNQHTGFGFVKG